MKRTIISLLLVGALLTPLAAAPGDYTDLGSGWGETKTMASMGGYLWIVYGDTLYRVDSGGNYQSMGSGWGETLAMTSLNNTVYIVYADTLYRVEAE